MFFSKTWFLYQYCSICFLVAIPRPGIRERCQLVVLTWMHQHQLTRYAVPFKLRKTRFAAVMCKLVGCSPFVSSMLGATLKSGIVFIARYSRPSTVLRWISCPTEDIGSILLVFAVWETSNNRTSDRLSTDHSRSQLKLVSRFCRQWTHELVRRAVQFQTQKSGTVRVSPNLLLGISWPVQSLSQ